MRLNNFQIRPLAENDHEIEQVERTLTGRCEHECCGCLSSRHVLLSPFAGGITVTVIQHFNY